MPSVTTILCSTAMHSPELVVADVSPDSKTVALAGTFADNDDFGLQLAQVHVMRHGDGSHTAVYQTTVFDEGKLARSPKYRLTLPAPFNKILVYGMAVLVSIGSDGQLRSFTHAQLDQLVQHNAASSAPIAIPKKAPAAAGPSIDSVLHALQREVIAAGVSIESRDDVIYAVDDEDIEDTSSSEDEDDEAHYFDDGADEFGEGDSDDEGDEGDVREEIKLKRGSTKRGAPDSIF